MGKTIGLFLTDEEVKRLEGVKPNRNRFITNAIWKSLIGLEDGLKTAAAPELKIDVRPDRNIPLEIVDAVIEEAFPTAKSRGKSA
ncbi:hypothetical protein MUO83_06360 [Candidatus Bathyarchaeota archaeon]|jgi:hypothetical protein|nr:hypothetical protein [Candidatus Bathyarchaeota archaeon]